MPVILLRHTRPRGGDGVCYGRTDLEPDDGFEDAARAILAALPPVARIASSPARRCLALAERVASARDVALRVDPRLAELDFGRWEGLRWADVPRVELDAWAADLLDARPHGGERVRDLEARVRAALAETPATRPPTLWVTHAGVARAGAALLGRPPGWDTTLAYGAWIDFAERAGEGSRQGAATRR